MKTRLNETVEMRKLYKILNHEEEEHRPSRQRIIKSLTYRLVDRVVATAAVRWRYVAHVAVARSHMLTQKRDNFIDRSFIFKFIFAFV